jgi:hypothetical protein
MTYREIIDLVDDLRPNAYEDDIKIKWLDLLDAQLYQEVVLTHEGDRDKYCYFDDETPTEDTESLVQPPYDYDIYVPYLQARIDRENGEDSKFNQSATLYNSGLDSWRNWYNRTHKPIGARRFRF